MLRDELLLEDGRRYDFSSPKCRPSSVYMYQRDELCAAQLARFTTIPLMALSSREPWVLVIFEIRASMVSAVRSSLSVAPLILLIGRHREENAY